MAKKEKLKLHRLPSNAPRKSHLLTGYVNYYDEFSQYDNLTLDATGIDEKGNTADTLGYKGPSPNRFFNDGKKNYKDIAFINEGVFIPYDRTLHNLELLQDSIWYVRSGDQSSLTGTRRSTGDVKDVGAFTEAVVDTLQFYLNPSSIKVIKRKLYKQLRTKGGWAFQHWGPQIGEVILEGTTGNIFPEKYPDQGVPTAVTANKHPEAFTDPTTEGNSEAYRQFLKLERWYDEDQTEQAQQKGQLLALEYRDRIFVGHFKEFMYDEVGTKPFQLQYRLNFQVHYDSTSLASGASRSQGRIIRNSETVNYIQDLQNLNEG